MDTQSVKSIHRITALILFSAALFTIFFQVNKAGAFVDANPFANDPYDAIGSFAIQISLLVGFLSYASVLRWRQDASQRIKSRLILHGNILVLASMLVTLCLDAVAEFIVPIPDSDWVLLLQLELGFMLLLTVLCGVALWLVFHVLHTPNPPTNLTPADAIDDMWSLVRNPVRKIQKHLPIRLVDWITHTNSDRIFKRARWIDPRHHPWRFTSTIALSVGIILVLVQLREGLPPSLEVGLLTMGIFITIEFSAILLGFAILGGYLGLRPNIWK